VGRERPEGLRDSFMLDRMGQEGLGNVGREDNVLRRRSDLGLTTPLNLPSSEAELKLDDIWRKVLGIDVIGIDDDFFELGGDSFAATVLTAAIESAFNVRLSIGDFIDCTTIAKQAQRVDVSLQGSTRVPPHIVVGRAEGSKTSLFFVHGVGGFSFFHPTFLDVVGEDRPIYLFQAPGIDGRTKPFKTVEDIARAYVTSMREIQPTGPYCIAGMCGGAFIALEMCNQLSDAEQNVAHLIFTDPSPTPPALAHKYTSSRGKTIFNLGYGLLRRISYAWRGDAPDALEHEQSLRARAARLKRRKERFPDATSYSPDDMLETSVQLYGALKTYIPRPFSGKATFVLSSDKLGEFIGDKSFWRDHLEDMDFQVLDGTHRDLFAVHIAEMASIVKSALDCPS